jgi:hypothetical protein
MTSNSAVANSTDSLLLNTFPPLWRYLLGRLTADGAPTVVLRVVLAAPIAVAPAVVLALCLGGIPAPSTRTARLLLNTTAPLLPYRGAGH